VAGDLPHDATNQMRLTRTSGSMVPVEGNPPTATRPVHDSDPLHRPLAVLARTKQYAAVPRERIRARCRLRSRGAVELQDGSGS